MNDGTNLILSKTGGVLLSLAFFKEKKTSLWHTAAQVLLYWSDSRGHRTGPIGLQPHYSTGEGEEM